MPEDFSIQAILGPWTLVVPDFGSVQIVLSISSMSQLNSMIDVNSRQITIQNESFVFKTCFHNRIKAHDTLTIDAKCMLPKAFTNGDFISKLFRPFTTYLPLNFVLKLKKGKVF